jgi:hypothetical protein
VSPRAHLALALCSLSLAACDGNVLVGFGPDAAAPNQPAQSGSGGAGDHADAGNRPVPSDATVGTGSADAKPPMDDAGGTRDDAGTTDAGRVDRPPADVTWISGAHAGNDYREYVDYGDWRGRPLDVATLYVDRTSWNNLVAPGWPVDMFAPFEGRLVLSVPLYPEGMGNNQDCASGAYDDRWSQLGAFLVDRDRADTILRLGWGPNDTAHAWRADADPSDWIECFRHVVTAIRSTDAEIAIDWAINPVGNPAIAGGDPFTTYPGDDYVDFVGMEAFDEYPPVRDDASWDAKCSSITGACSLASFARSHGKKVAFAEWGVAGCGDDPGGDNPFFVRKMFDFFADNADILAYEAYFESAGDICSALEGSDAMPDASAEYQRLYGPR